MIEAASTSSKVIYWAEPSSDCWSIGMICFELLGGASIFEDMDQDEVAWRISCWLPVTPERPQRDMFHEDMFHELRNDAFVREFVRNFDVSCAEFLEIAFKLTASAPEKRYSAGEAAAVLARLALPSPGG